MGLKVGESVGLSDGDNVGDIFGLFDWSASSEPVGLSVGLSVGLRVGVYEGIAAVGFVVLGLAEVVIKVLWVAVDLTVVGNAVVGIAVDGLAVGFAVAVLSAVVGVTVLGFAVAGVTVLGNAVDNAVGTVLITVCRSILVSPGLTKPLYGGIVFVGGGDSVGLYVGEGESKIVGLYVGVVLFTALLNISVAVIPSTMSLSLLRSTACVDARHSISRLVRIRTLIIVI